ncbi:transposase [Streptomyces sp. ISID311]|uniref:transposase n=1 Tax=Streptomyces sp. ISID311 TaxID=2601673 RepID=UPI001C9A8F2D|nr:transposase [Streptomyces sp. ISID311]
MRKFETSCSLPSSRGNGSSLTDAMWEAIQPLLPVCDLRKGGGVRKYGDRLVLDSIFYVLRSGWRRAARGT